MLPADGCNVDKRGPDYRIRFPVANDQGISEEHRGFGARDSV